MGLVSNCAKLIGSLVMSYTLLVPTASAQEKSTDPNIKRVIEDVVANRNSRSSNIFEKTYANGTFIQYHDQSPGLKEPDGKIGEGDWVMVRTADGQFCEQNLNGFPKSEPNESAVVFGLRPDGYNWDTNPDGMRQQHQPYLDVFATIASTYLQTEQAPAQGSVE